MRDLYLPNRGCQIVKTILDILQDTITADDSQQLSQNFHTIMIECQLNYDHTKSQLYNSTFGSDGDRIVK